MLNEPSENESFFAFNIQNHYVCAGIMLQLCFLVSCVVWSLWLLLLHVHMLHDSVPRCFVCLFLFYFLLLLFIVRCLCSASTNKSSNMKVKKAEVYLQSLCSSTFLLTLLFPLHLFGSDQQPYTNAGSLCVHSFIGAPGQI